MNLFGIGYQEIVVIMVVALIIFGPNRMPELAGQAARWMRDARKMMTELSSEFEKSAGVKEFKDAIEGEIKGVKAELEGAGAAVKKDLNAAAGTANKAFSSAANAAKGGSKGKAGASSAGATSTKASAGATATASKVGKPKATKADPFAGLVQMTEVTPKRSRVSVAAANGSVEPSKSTLEPTRETSEAVMRARERRLNAGYNRHIATT